MNGAIAVLVVAERLQRQRLQAGFLFGEHRRYLPFGSAVDSGVGPAFFPVIQIGLGLFQALETLALQRRLFGMPDSGFDLNRPQTRNRRPDPARSPSRCGLATVPAGSFPDTTRK